MPFHLSKILNNLKNHLFILSMLNKIFIGIGIAIAIVATLYVYSSSGVDNQVSNESTSEIITESETIEEPVTEPTPTGRDITIELKESLGIKTTP